MLRNCVWGLWVGLSLTVPGWSEESPTAIVPNIAGHWQVFQDAHLDGQTRPEPLDSKQPVTILQLEAANGRFSGHYRGRQARAQPNPSLFSGAFSSGEKTTISMRQDDNRSNYTAFFAAHFESTDKIVGVYFDTNGVRGDFVLKRLAAEEVSAANKPTTLQRIEPLDAEVPEEEMVESMLGVYGEAIRGRRHPYVSTRVPLRNLWTDDIEEMVGGDLPYAKVDYMGEAKLVVPKDGVYIIDIPTGVELRFNGERVGAGEVHLRKGLYQVSLYTNHWGQPYLKYAHAKVISKETRKPLTFVNSTSDVKKFVRQKIDGRQVVLVDIAKPRGKRRRDESIGSRP